MKIIHCDIYRGNMMLRDNEVVLISKKKYFIANLFSCINTFKLRLDFRSAQKYTRTIGYAETSIKIKQLRAASLNACKRLKQDKVSDLQSCGFDSISLFKVNVPPYIINGYPRTCTYEEKLKFITKGIKEEVENCLSECCKINICTSFCS